MLVNSRFSPVGLSDSISLSRLLTLTAVSPEAVCSMPTTWFFRRASKYFSATLTASRLSANTTTKETTTVKGH